MPSSASESSPSHDMGRGADAVPFALAEARMFTMFFSSVSDSSSSSICSIFGTVIRTAPVAVVANVDD